MTPIHDFDKTPLEQPTIDIVSPLKGLKETAERRASLSKGFPTEFLQGYLMAIGHAIELAEIFQQRIDIRLGTRGKDLAFISQSPLDFASR